MGQTLLRLAGKSSAIHIGNIGSLLVHGVNNLFYTLANIGNCYSGRTVQIFFSVRVINPGPLCPFYTLVLLVQIRIEYITHTYLYLLEMLNLKFHIV